MASIPGRITVIVPAFNEEESIGKVLSTSIKWRNQDPKNRFLAVVNDGSSDMTEEIAKTFGVEVVFSDPKNHKNLGKGNAFLAGVKYAARKKSEILVTLDADLIRAEPKDIDILVGQLLKTNSNMVVSKGLEYGSSPFFSGERAIRMSSLTPLLKRHPAWLKMIKGYGLETALNYFIKKREFINANLEVGPALRRREKVLDDIGLAEKLIKERKTLALLVRTLLKAGKRDEAWELLRRHGRPLGIHKPKRTLKIK